MKQFLLLFAAFFMFSNLCFAQNSIKINIHHKLGSDDFAMNTGAKNNLNNDFIVNRLEYYLSEISIVHDGGNETLIEDMWVLVDAAESTTIDLGEHDITSVEGINFHVGVDPDHNHLDPASWGNGHPLAPKFPSMHWGWAAGYRFIALEGKGAADFSQTYQLHGLGDVNYFKTEIALEATASNNAITINIDGDYTRLLEDIDVSSGTISHGEIGDAKKALENARDFTFSPSATVLSTPDFTEVQSVDLFPNPTNSGWTALEIKSSENNIYNIAITDILGRNVQELADVNSNQRVNLNITTKGVYLVSLLKEGYPVMTKKLVVQ